MEFSLLKVTDLNVFYGDAQALWDIEFHGYKGTWAHEFYNALGPDAEGVLMDGFWSEDLPYPGAKELGTRYAKEFGKDSVSTGLYYAICQILWEAIEKAGSLDSARIKEAVLCHKFKGTVMEDVKYDRETNTAIHYGSEGYSTGGCLAANSCPLLGVKGDSTQF